jgi:hypothetical protein
MRLHSAPQHEIHKTAVTSYIIRGLSSLALPFLEARMLIIAVALLSVLASITVRAEDLYGTLGLTRGASAKEVKKQFRKLSRQFHPDINSQPDAKDRYTSIIRAYSILDDPQKRAQYDQFGIADDQARSQARGFPHPFFFRSRPPSKPIESSTRLLSLSDFVLEVQQYRGRRLRVVQVFADEAWECHTFAPAWENLAKSSIVRHQADFFRINANDRMLMEVADLSLTSLPSVFVYVNGESYHISLINVASPVRVLEHFVSGFYVDIIKQLKTDAIHSDAALREIVSDSRFKKTLVALNVDDLNFNQVAPSLYFLSDSIDVVAVSGKLLTGATAACGALGKLKTTSVWVFNSHSGEVCNSAKFPAGRLDDEDGIVRFVTKRMPKPMPALTNHSFQALCAGEERGGCIIDVRAQDNRDLPPLVQQQATPTEVPILSADVNAVPSLLELLPRHQISSGLYTVLALDSEGWAAATAIGLTEARQFVQSARDHAISLQPLPDTWYIPADAFFIGRWRRFWDVIETWYSRVPFANVLGLIGLWGAYKFIGGRFARAPRAAPAPPQPDPPTQAETTQPPEPRRASAATPSPPPRPADVRSETGSRTYPGPSGSHETVRKNIISGLSPSDAAEMAKTPRLLLVLMFSSCEGVKAPAEAARLLQYREVCIRAVPQKCRRWWQWLREHDAGILAAAAESKQPVIVAIRGKRAHAGIKPLERNLQLWVDEILEGGNRLLTLPVDVQELSTMTE